MEIVKIDWENNCEACGDKIEQILGFHPSLLPETKAFMVPDEAVFVCEHGASAHAPTALLALGDGYDGPVLSWEIVQARAAEKNRVRQLRWQQARQ